MAGWDLKLQRFFLKLILHMKEAAGRVKGKEQEHEHLCLIISFWSTGKIWVWERKVDAKMAQDRSMLSFLL